MNIGGRDFIDYEAAGAMTGVSRSILQRLVAGGMIGSARPGRKRLLAADDLKRWLEAQVAQARRPVGRPRAGTRR